MTNDTNTLTGALRELGETMAANLTTQGVASTYDEGLTTLAGKILDISGGGGGTVASVSLTGSSAILSYADSDSLTLTATVLDSSSAGVSGETVEFFNGSTSMGTATTNSSGVATKTYASTGAGDLSFSATCSSISSETYVVEDCLYNDTTTYSSEVTKSISLPSTFKLEFDLYPLTRNTSSGGASHYVKMTRSGTNDIWVGQGTSAGKHGIMLRPSTNYWCTSLTTLNTENHVTVTYDGSTVSYTCNNEEVTLDNSTAFNTISGVSATRNAYVKNLKVKPL